MRVHSFHSFVLNAASTFLWFARSALDNLCLMPSFSHSFTHSLDLVFRLYSTLHLRLRVRVDSRSDCACCLLPLSLCVCVCTVFIWLWNHFRLPANDRCLPFFLLCILLLAATIGSKECFYCCCWWWWFKSVGVATNERACVYVCVCLSFISLRFVSNLSGWMCASMHLYVWVFRTSHSRWTLFVIMMVLRNAVWVQVFSTYLLTATNIHISPCSCLPR